MGAPGKATRGRLAKLGAPGLLALALLLLTAPQALAASPLKVREAFPGSSALGANVEFVELQMTATGQNDINGQVLQFYDKAGELASTYPIPSDVANGQSQRTVLFATQEAVTSFPALPTPDFNLGAGTNRMDPAGGAVCLTGFPADCVSWGEIPISTILDPFLPNGQFANAAVIADGQSLTRKITRGCATYLDGSDDTDNSQSDFAQIAPTPRNNATTPTEVRCPPDTLLSASQANPTNQTSINFTYTEAPDESGASFECKLDAQPFASCPGAGKSYAGLADGSHTFAVKAIGEGGPDPTPKTFTWAVDTLTPETTIDSGPLEPSGGFSAPFTYHSSEPSSTFKCQLDAGPIQTCPGAGKTYFQLADGAHVFRVWAADNAGNQDPSAATRTFTVQGVLIDQTPPDTLIVSSPANPSPKDSGSFAYSSTESPARFECRLDAAAFALCPATGVSYPKLKNGRHSFEVRAIDAAGNVDSVPASFAWTVAAPLPNTKFTRSPPGSTRIKAPKRKAKLILVFGSDAPGSTFRCRLDKEAFARCGPKVTIKVGVGRHRFEVYAVDALGNVETTPARRIFRVQVKKGGGLF